MLKKYWVVEGPDGVRTSHSTQNEANSVAYANADQNPDSAYLVLEVKGYYQTPRPKPEYRKL